MNYDVYDRPAGTVSMENPARFTWMPRDEKDHSYRILVRRNGEICHEYSNIPYNFYTPESVMEPGDYTYEVFDETGILVSEKAFSIHDRAVATPLKGREGRYESIGAHPRIWLNQEDIPVLQERVRGDLKEQWEAFLKSGVDPWSHVPVKPEPLPYPGNKRIIPIWRQMYTDCQEALYAVKHNVVAWRVTGESVHLETAKRWLLALAGWDVEGPTARTYNDEAAFRVTTALAWGYDWLCEELTQEEKAKVREALLLRGRELFSYVRDQISIHIKLLDSHGVRSLSMTLVPAALALFGEEREAEEWLNYTIEYFFCIFSPWGGEDGGWAEGPTYWQSGMSFFAEAISLIRKATGLDVFKRPFFTNTGDFILNTYCQDTRFMGFGDMSDLGDYPGLKAGYTMRILSAATSSPNRREYAWYYEQAKKRGRGTEKLFYNYGWWNFDFDELFFHMLYEPVEPKAPDEGRKVKWFRDIGWVTIHTHMAEEENHLAFQFKASPYGSVSHSHGDQNAFVLHAFGEPLAIQSGYYIGFWSSMHTQWRRHTKSKNAVLIDGTGQFAKLRQNTEAEKMNGSAKTQFDQLIAANGRIVECREKEGYVSVIGDATPAFQKTVPYLLKNQRKVLFVGNRFFVIIDEIELVQAGKVEWMLHGLYPFEIGADCVSLTGRKAGMKVIFANTKMNFTQSDVFEGVNPDEYEGLGKQWHLCGETVEKKMKHKIVAVLYPYALGKEEELSLEWRDGGQMEVRLGEEGFWVEV